MKDELAKYMCRWCERIIYEERHTRLDRCPYCKRPHWIDIIPPTVIPSKFE